MAGVFLPNRELEKLTTKEKIAYFSKLREYCMNASTKREKKLNIGHEIITKIYPNLRSYDYEIIGLENIPDNGKALFLCNHSNSHDFFTAHEVFKKVGSNVSVFCASDDLNFATATLFRACDAVLIDREDKASAEKGICDFSASLMTGMPGVLFGESTWNLHPYKPMQQLKIGAANIAAITDVPIIPTIFEYVEVPRTCDKESELYTVCLVKFGQPIKISKEESLVSQTNTLQTIMEQNRLQLWNDIGTMRKSLDDVDQEIYLNHTYLKKFGALGFTYDSESEAKFLFSKDNQPVENEYHLDENGNFVPGVTYKKTRVPYTK